MVRETSLEPSDFIAPLFVVHGSGVRDEIKTMPGQYRLSVDELVKECHELYRLGVLSVMLFGIPAHKDATGSEAYSDEGIVQQAIRALKTAIPDLIVIADICMCEYTDHGHCGILHEHYTVDNDATLPYLARQAVSLAQAGADIVAPSDMMDGRIAVMREALDQAGFSPMRRSSVAPSMVLSGMLQTLPLASETAVVTRWILRMRGRQCVRSKLISRRELTW